MHGLTHESAIHDEPETPAAASVAPPARRLSVRALRTHPVAAGGVLLLAIFIVAGVIGPLIEPHPPDTLYPTAILQPPGGAFPFGTDDLGRDLLSRILSGMRVSLAVGLGSIAAALLVGAGLGLLGGYVGGLFDTLMMRVMDVLVAFPALLLAIALMTMLGGSLLNVALAIAIIYVPIFARIMRSSVLAVRAEPYVEAVRAVGASHQRTLLRHVLPNSISATVIQTSLAISDAILIEAALSYLGLGVTPPTPSLGALLTEGQGFMTTQPWMVIFPGEALTLGVFGFNLVGDSLRDLLDPRGREG
jgi:peptide/nickel transport system permease protein